MGEERGEDKKRKRE